MVHWGQLWDEMKVVAGMITVRKISMFLPLIAVPLIFVNTAFAQHEKYSLDHQIEGSAFFSRNQETGEKDGSFYFVSFTEDSVDADYYLKYKLKGNYQNDLKSGDWSYNFKRLTPQGGLSIESLSFTESAGGGRFKIEGGFDGDEPEGNWEAMENAVDFSEIQDTAFYCTFNFDEGRLQRDFFISANNTTVRGRLDQSGFLHGKVTFDIQINGNKIVDSRTFDHGRLTASQLKIDGEVIERSFLGLKVPSDTSSQFVELSWGEEYLKVMQLSHFVSSPSLKEFGLDAADFQLIGDTVLLNALQALTHHKGIAVWPGQPTFSYPKIKVVAQTISSGKQERVKRLVQHFDTIDKSVHQVLHDDQLEIAANADRRIAVFQAIYELFQREVIPGYRSVVDLLKNPALRYLDEQVLLDRLKERKQLPDSLVVEQADTVVYFPFDQESIDEKDEIIAIDDQLGKIITYLESLGEQIRPVLNREKQRLSLTRDESTMVDLRDSIHALYNHPSNNTFQKRMSIPVINVTQRRFKAYAQLPLNEKINRLSEINACFRNLIDFYFLLKVLPDRRKAIEELYTRTVWNPFTYTDMEETVKERLYSAYDEILFPYLLDRIEEQLSCNNIDAILVDLPALFKKMEVLREQDTQEKEKSLRREDDPEVIKDIIELEVNLF